MYGQTFIKYYRVKKGVSMRFSFYIVYRNGNTSNKNI